MTEQSRDETYSSIDPATGQLLDARANQAYLDSLLSAPASVPAPLDDAYPQAAGEETPAVEESEPSTTAGDTPWPPVPESAT